MYFEDVIDFIICDAVAVADKGVQEDVFKTILLKVDTTKLWEISLDVACCRAPGRLDIGWMACFTDIVKEVAISEHVDGALVVEQYPVLVQIDDRVHHVEGDALCTSVITSAVVFTDVTRGGLVIKVIGVFAIVALAGVLVCANVHVKHGIGGLLQVMSWTGSLNIFRLFLRAWAFIGIMLLVLPAPVTEEIRSVLLLFRLAVALLAIVLIEGRVAIFLLDCHSLHGERFPPVEEEVVGLCG